MNTRMEILRRIAIIIITCICSLPPTLAQNKMDIVDRLETSLGVSLPSPYRAKIKEFVATNKVLADEGTNAFTENFIMDEMKKEWKINKQNQLLFLWFAIYNIITDKFIYDENDGNEAIFNDYSDRGVKLRIRACGYKYKEKTLAYFQQRSEEARQRSEEARQRSEEARQRSAEYDQRSAEYDQRIEAARQQSAEAIQTRIIGNHDILFRLIKFYSIYTRNPALVKQEELDWLKNKCFIETINDCQEINIDYQSLLPLEVQKFYGLKPADNQQNTITCDMAKVQILNILLKEIVNLYNIYQKAPNAERKIKDISPYIECFKEYNIDYKQVLTLEMLKFFGMD